MKKNLDYYMNLPYTIIVKKDKDNSGSDHYYASVLEFPCLGDGNTPQEAFECLDAHMRMAIKAYLKDGIPIPEPQIEYSGNINIRVDSALHASLSREAGAYGMSLNKYTGLILERRGQPGYEAGIHSEPAASSKPKNQQQERTNNQDIPIR